ncbi:MAG: hypothetical protein KA807_05500 [Prolixibacteraceae bacterium]|nr:hypothetical protein [Prolixibacteraceae bacterium]
MIDYIKDNNLPVSVREILAHEKLTFPMSNVATTGEILNRSQVAHYGKMEFVVKGRYVKLRGSLHEHAQGGTNYNDFTFPDIQREIEELVNTFHFDPKEAHLNFIEVGVNIVVSTDPTTLIKNFLLYRNKEFKTLPVTGKGYGRKYESQQMMIKVYNKSLQNELPYHLLRFEVKIKRMEFLKKYGINSLTMDDLRRPDVYPKLLKMLLVVFNRIFLFNPELDMDSIHNSKDRELVMQGRFPEYWSELPRQRKLEQIKRFQELTGTNNLKKELAHLISEKWNQLMFPDKLTTLQTNHDVINTDKLTTLMVKQEPSEPDILTTFKKIQFIGSKDKIGQINTTINGYSHTCPVTKVDISMQNKGSRFLSTTGLRWLKDNNPEQYQNILKGFLPNHGIKVIHTKYEKDEITHIAKQIRNQYHNRRRYFDRIPANQLSFL